MQILFLTRRFWPQIGGVEKHSLEIARQLVKLGHKVTVVAETPSVKPSTSEESKSLLRHHPRCLKAYQIPITASERLKKFQIWWWLWKNRNLLKEADIIHTHDVGFWYWPFRLLYPRKKFFITFHGWEGKFPLPLKNKIIRKISERMACDNICVGDYLKKWYGTKTDFITYGGVDNSPRRSHGFTVVQPATIRGVFQIVFAGRLEKDTGLLIYFRALELLNKKYSIPYTTYPILFLGDGRLRAEAEKFGRVLGFVKDIRPHILKSRFVFTSGYLSILEAMACKRLVFAVYDNPLKKDYLKMAPFADWIVIESSAKALFNRLKYYCKQPKEERKLIDKAYDWVRKQSWEKVVEMYFELWFSHSRHPEGEARRIS